MTADPRFTTRRKVLATSGSLAALGMAGCLGGDDEENGDEDDDETETYDIAEFELLDRDHDEEVTAYIHDDHWHGSPLVVPHDDNLSLGAYIETEDGEEIDFDDGYELDAEVVEGANEIVEIDSHGDHIHVHGEEEGFTDLVFQLVAEGDVVYETPELEVDVGDDHGHEHGHVDRLTILDRAHDPHEEVAEFHDDHWEEWSELPHIHVDDNVSLGGEFVDDHGDEIHIGSDYEYELGVRVCEEAEEGIVEIDEEEDFHGDHVHIHGVAEGETEVVFMLWHDDHADWESDPITIEVEDH